MRIYKLNNRETKWGDYGSILVSGMTAHIDRKDNLLQLERTGPYVPPLVNSGLWDIVVTDKTKKNLESSMLNGLSFKTVIKKHIVELDWVNWDLQASEPPFYPESGEPEDYILARPHSDSASDQIGKLWELVISIRGTFNNDVFFDTNSQADIFKADNRGYILVTERAKHWIENNANDWVDFELV